MTAFRFLTPVSYWLLIGMWTFILVFYLRRLKSKKIESKLFTTLIIILAIDAFRTLFESVYFGAWYTSRVGLIPQAIHDLLVRPELVFVLKFVNVTAAVLVIVILLHRWLPHEEAERARQADYIRELEEQIARRRRTEKALTESTLWLKSIFEALAEGVFVASPDGQVIDINPAAEKMFGYRKDELVNLSSEVLHVDHQHFQEFRERVRKAFDKGEAASFEFAAKRKNGEIFPAELTVSLLREEGDRPLGIVCVVRDITHRKRAEAALKKSEERFRLVADFTYNCEYWRGSDGNLLYVSPSCERVSGYPAESFLNDPSLMRRIVHPKDIDKLSAHLEAHCIQEAGPGHLEFRIIIRDGEERWIEHFCQPVFDEEGRWLGRRASNLDITERKRAEAALWQAKERFEKVFTSQREAIFILDASVPPRILDCNPAALTIFGYQKEDMLGRTTAFLHVSEESLKKFQEGLYSTIERQGFFEISDFDMKRKDETVFPSDISVSPLLSDKGERVGWVSIVRDITERKRVEAALKKSEALFRDLVEKLPFPVVVGTAAKETEYVNPKFTEIFGYTAEDVPNQRLWRERFFPDPEYRAEVGSEVDQWIDSGQESVTFHRLYIDKVGQKHDVVVHVINFKDRFYNIIEDVTELKRAEEERERQIKLDGVVEMAGTACHELNQPLQAAVGQVELLLRQVAGDEAMRDRVNTILEQLDRLGQITAKLQEITKYETTDYIGGRARIIDLERATEKE